MMLREPTDAELAQTFHQLVARITAGELFACPSDTGFDAETEAAVTAFAQGTISAATAGEELVNMLDGTHARATAARIEHR